jgi:Zn-finger nucleic acid-binding protein
MTAHLIAEALLDQCNECGGLWVDQAAFERITADSERQESTLTALGTLTAAREAIPADSMKVVYLRCPDCDAIMMRKNFAHRSGVIVDVCSAHGIWFDREELARVIRFVREGGLADAKRRDLEEMKSEAERARWGAIRDARLGSTWGPADRPGSGVGEPASLGLLFTALSGLFD